MGILLNHLIDWRDQWQNQIKFPSMVHFTGAGQSIPGPVEHHQILGSSPNVPVYTFGLSRKTVMSWFTMLGIPFRISGNDISSTAVNSSRGTTEFMMHDISEKAFERLFSRVSGMWRGLRKKRSANISSKIEGRFWVGWDPIWTSWGSGLLRSMTGNGRVVLKLQFTRKLSATRPADPSGCFQKWSHIPFITRLNPSRLYICN